ncbi:helix-turn-helix domain-containing protein [Steroidobacter cummioxidans]|uniref:helix-turn-helix domain-containing protein n=1 Tax=Steroidobacter cummioxidans TaxID=1803913 RepID=UPI000E31B9D6|nr:helix-turn-helix domain-containing protein [Steroidobacter cummioxidans]
MLQRIHTPPQAGACSLNAVPEVFVDECKSDFVRVAVPSTGTHVVVRFGAHISGGFDIHALGPRHKVHRKLIRGGQSTVFARLPLGTYQAVLGRPASELAGRIVALRDLWDTAATQRLEEQLAAASDAGAAAKILKAAIAERLEPRTCFDANTRLALKAARGLESGNVASVAQDLGISERHLRRVFREVIGLSPKTLFKLIRFERALKAAKECADLGWSDIAVSAGYYDQAHLIADFRSIAAATPRRFLAEVCSQS